MFLAQADTNFWAYPNGSSQLTTWILIGLAVGILLFFGIMKAPTRLRRPIVAAFTFIAGSFFVLFYIWPSPIDRQPDELPQGPIESVGFWLKDAIGVFADFANIITAFLLGLGVYSLLRVHVGRLVKRQRDWFFSLVLLVSLVAMTFFGFADWASRLGTEGAKFDERVNWTYIQIGRDFLFEGLLQQMDAAMFSIIAFYIMSAAYRAFRVRSIEATILLAAALIVILNLMGAVTGLSDSLLANAPPLLQNLKLREIADWLRNSFQTPSIQAITFGTSIGALAMGIRLWLSLEKTGGVS